MGMLGLLLVTEMRQLLHLIGSNEVGVLWLGGTHWLTNLANLTLRPIHLCDDDDDDVLVLC